MLDLYQKSTLLLPMKGDLLDYSPSGITPTNTGVTLSTDVSYWSGYGASAYFDGSSYLTIPPGLIDLSADTFIVTMRVYLTVSPSGTALFANAFPSSGNPIPCTVWFGGSSVTTSGDYLCCGFYDGSSWTKVVSDFEPELKTWYTISLRKYGGVFTLYVDSEIVASLDLGATPAASDYGIYIGRRWDTAGTIDYITGYMQDFGIFTSHSQDANPEVFLGKISNSGTTMVLDGGGNALEGISVIASARCNGSQRAWHTLTDEDGAFSLDVANYYVNTRIRNTSHGYADICETKVIPVAYS